MVVDGDGGAEVGEADVGDGLGVAGPGEGDGAATVGVPGEPVRLAVGEGPAPEPERGEHAATNEPPSIARNRRRST